MALDKVTLKDFVPEKGAALLMATANVFAEESPFPHCNVPFADV